MTRGGDWSAAEVEAIVADYMAMFALELRGLPLNKAEHNRQLRQRLEDRTRSSVEFKHQNISAALDELDLPHLSGYVPLANRQELLFRCVDARLVRDTELMNLIRHSAESAVDAEAPTARLPTFEPPPAAGMRVTSGAERPVRTFRPPVNYLEREARNASIGRAGEELVLRIEAARLIDEGRKDLVKGIEHTSVLEGDGAGYDIRSFEADGSERLIEVKTTGYAKTTPFFVTRNELAVSNAHASSYQLYRVFSMRSAPRLFALRGALDASCRLIPEIYSGRVA